VRYQTTQATCAAAAVLNALSALEHVVSEDQVVAASGIKDTTKGMGEREIKRALTSLGYDHGEIYTASESHGWLFLRDALVFYGRPVIMAVDRDKHWVAAVGTLGERVALADGAHNDMMVYRPRASLMPRWHSGGRTGYYGIVIEPRAK